jgi:hypothetical protein
MTTSNFGALTRGNVRGVTVSNNSAPQEIYRFSLAEASLQNPVNLNAALIGLVGDSDLEIFFDSNGNGIFDEGDRVVATSNRAGTADESVNMLLTNSGDYFVRVRPVDNQQPNSYTLLLSNTGVGMSDLLPVEYASRTLNVGTTTGAVTGAALSRNNTMNTYQFTMAEAGNFNASLTGVPSSQNAYLRLVQDKNNNGRIDAGEIIASSFRPGDDGIHVKNLEAGTYMVQTLFAGGPAIANPFTYRLRMSNTGTDFSNLVLGEHALTFDSRGMADVSSHLRASDNLTNTYRFTTTNTQNFNAGLFSNGISSRIDMRLVQDVNNNGIIDAADRVIDTNRQGPHSAINVRNLDAGTYFLQTNLAVGNSGTYTVRLASQAGEASNTIVPDQVSLGSLGQAAVVRNNRMTLTDTNNTYHFTMAAAGNFNAALTDITRGGNVNMRLIRDANNNGVVDPGEVIVSSTSGQHVDDAINVRNLEAGSYILQTYLYGNQPADYTLKMSNSGPSPISNLLPTEINVGARLEDPTPALGSTPFVRNDSVSRTDGVDVYRLRIGERGNFNAALRNIPVGANVDMFLMRDANNNGIVDAGDYIVGSSKPGNANEALNVRDLEAGIYFLQVGYGHGSTVRGNYTIQMSSTGNAPSNLITPEHTIASIPNTSPLTGQLNHRNAADTFQFRVSGTVNSPTRNVRLTLSGLSANADLRLIHDRNNNGIIDDGELLSSATRLGSQSESISRHLAPGNYIAQVYLPEPGQTSYTLNIS